MGNSISRHDIEIANYQQVRVDNGIQLLKNPQNEADLLLSRDVT